MYRKKSRFDARTTVRGKGRFLMFTFCLSRNNPPQLMLRYKTWKARREVDFLVCTFVSFCKGVNTNVQGDWNQTSSNTYIYSRLLWHVWLRFNFCIVQYLSVSGKLWKYIKFYPVPTLLSMKRECNLHVIYKSKPATLSRRCTLPSQTEFFVKALVAKLEYGISASNPNCLQTENGYMSLQTLD